MDWWPTVHLAQGQLAQPTPALPTLAAALDWARENTGRVCLVDRTGIDANRPDMALYQAIASRLDLWIDAGPRSIGDVMDLALTGAGRVTARTRLLPATDLADAVATADGLVLGVEARGGHVLEHQRGTAWADARTLAETRGVPLVAIEVGRAGTRSGIDRATAHLLSGLQPDKWYAGGIGGPHDLETLEDLKYAGALVGASWLEEPGIWPTAKR